jgi:hypothetical protein
MSLLATAAGDETNVTHGGQPLYLIENTADPGASRDKRTNDAELPTGRTAAGPITKLAQTGLA